jgi:HTH-type transcriptional regulator/antitoxin HigA
MIDFSAVKAIRTEEEYQAALAAIRPYFDDEPDTDTEAGARFEALAILIGHYEDRRFPIAPPTPLEALRFRMEQSGRTQADLAALLNSRSRASEILSGRRALSLDQIRTLHRAWGIPVASLVGEAERA